MRILEALREQRELLEAQIAASRAGTAGYTIDVGYGQGDCPICGKSTVVQKTSRRNVVTLMHSHFIALEHVTSCPSGCLHPNGKAVVGHSEKLAGLVPQGARYGYDIEALVGTERFLYNAQREEIREKLLSQHGIEISTGEISNLTKRFLAHIESLHYNHAPELRAAMESDGGYPLHIDATTEDGKGTMLVLYSGWRRWVLGAWKIPSESAGHIAPRITEMAEMFGEPCAIMRDLGKPMKKAAEEAGAKMASPPRQRACQFHFLKDVGKGMLGESYGRLRELARSHNIRENVRAVARALKKDIGSESLAKFQRAFEASISGGGFPQIADAMAGTILVTLLAQWVLEYRQSSGNESFPFGRPLIDLYERCQAASDVLRVFQMQPGLDGSANRHAQRLQNAICPFMQDDAVAQTVRKLYDRIVLFDNLRAIFKLESQMPETAPPLDSDVGKNIDNGGKNQKFEEFEANMKRDVEKLLASLKEKHQILPQDSDIKKAVKIVIDHLDNHWRYLWGHQVRLHVEGETFYRIIERTNNLLETFFHELKHRERRRSGRKNLSNDFDNLPASAAIAANLLDDDYVRIVCGTLNSLPSLFSQIDQKNRNFAYSQEPPPIRSNEADVCGPYVLPNNKTFVRKPVFNDWVNNVSIQSSLSEPASDTMSTGENVSPFIIIDCLMSRFVPAQQSSAPTSC